MKLIVDSSKFWCRIVRLLVVFVTTTASPHGQSMADSAEWGISIGNGNGNHGIDFYRFGVKKEFYESWDHGCCGYLSGYFELSANRWESEADEINGIAFSPVFVYSFGQEGQPVKPYIEGGIGLTYLDQYKISGRNLSTNFQFEDRIGLGVIIYDLDLNFRYMHYSNASIKGPNDGLDLFVATIAVKF